MAYPALVKTWQVSANNALAARASNTLYQHGFINKIVKLMQAPATNPWVAVNSSNAGAVGGVNYGGVAAGDNWVIDNATLTQVGGVITVPNDVNNAAAGNRHSWIVLRQTGIATNYEVCFDLGSGSDGLGSVVISPSVGFSGGTVTARPTASDEIVLVSTSNFSDNNNADHKFHYMQSTDGQCSRMMIWRATTNNAVFLLFDKPQYPISGWTNPSVGVYLISAAAKAAVFANFGQSTSNAKGLSGSTALNIGFGYESYSNGTALQSATGIGTAVNTFSSEWPVLPVSVAVSNNGKTGKIGVLFDLWWKASGVADADTFPNDANHRQYAAMADFVFPWTNDAAVPALT